MAVTVDYYFSLISPFSYLGHQAFHAVAAKHGAHIAYKPMNLFDVFKTSGAVPVPQRPASRQAYRFVELQRIAHVRGIPLTLRPAHWPTNPDLANGAVAALVHAGEDPSAFMLATFQACWVHDRDIADPAVLADLLTSTAHQADALLAKAAGEDMINELAANTESAIEAGIVGAPGYVLNGEPFWGQDRVEYLDHALTTGRAAFSANV